MKKCMLVFLFGLSNILAAQQLIPETKGKLIYNLYANQGQSEKVNIVPNFSFAGYRRGGVSLRDVKTVLSLSPQEGDCRHVIQEAIDKVSLLPLDKHGQRGAVLLKKGIYKVDSTLFIKASGVVLRGEGNGTDGTVLIATQRSRHDFIVVQGEGSGYGEVTGSRKKIYTTFVPTGQTSFEVEPGHTFSKGDAIVIQKTPNDVWIKELEMAQYGWTAHDYKMYYERTVTGVTKNKITIDIPLVDPLEEKYGGGDIFKPNIQGRIMQCGIENMRLESVFENDDDEEHAWNAVVLKRAVNCWVKDVVAKYFGYACVNISTMSVFNTVQDCAMIDPKAVTTGARKYSFNIEYNSTCNLFQRCVSWGGRHDYVTGAKVPGPNVFLDCVAENTFADIGPHHRWSTGVLFDNVYGGEMRVQNRKAMGSGHGWAGVQTLFWNCLSVAKEIKVESPTGAMNWGVGCVGLNRKGDGYWESWGNPVTPRSLYLKQLEERLGAKAVKNVTTPLQQKSTALWNALKEWARQLAYENRVA